MCMSIDSLSDVTIIGVDPSMRHIGVSVIVGEKIVAAFCIKPSIKLKGVALLKSIAGSFDDIVKAHHPDHWAIEGYSYGSVGMIAQLGEVAGVIKLKLAKEGAVGIIIAPSRAKKYTGSGKASKVHVMNFVTEQEGIAMYSSDIADAIVIGRIAQAVLQYRLNGYLPKNRKQAEVIVAEANKHP